MAQFPSLPFLSRAFSNGAVKAAQPSGPILAVTGLADGGAAEEDPHAHMTPKAVVELLDRCVQNNTCGLQEWLLMVRIFRVPV